MEFKKKLESLKPLDLNCNIFSVYDYEGFSVQELLYKFFMKLNEIIDDSNTMHDLLNYLIGIGLEEQVAIRISELIEDGTLATIVNEQAIEDFAKLKKNTEANVYDFGAKGDGVTDDWKAIQDTIDFVKSKGGGKVKFKAGKYLISKPLFISDYVYLEGEGATTEIHKIKGGTSVLSTTLNYQELTRTDMIQYDACIVSCGTTYYFGIKDLHFQSSSTEEKIGFGFLLPYIGLAQIENVTIYHCMEGIRLMNAWSINLEAIRMRYCTIGLIHEKADESASGGTSWNVNRIGFDYCDYGMKLRNVMYSSFNTVTSDHINKRAYWFENCTGLKISGLGYEHSKGQIIKMNDSNIVIDGFYFIWCLPVENRPTDMTKEALIEITKDKFATGLSIRSGEFIEDSSNLYKFYLSDGAGLVAEHCYSSSGKGIQELETTSEGNYRIFDNFETVLNGRVMGQGRVRLAPIDGIEREATFLHYPTCTVYNDSYNTATKTELIIPLTALDSNFEFMKPPMNIYKWLPVRITVQSGYEGATNIIWICHDRIKIADRLIFDDDIINTISCDGTNIKFEFSKPVNRIKIIFSLC